MVRILLKILVRAHQNRLPISSGNYVASQVRQAIIWSNDDPVASARIRPQASVVKLPINFTAVKFKTNWVREMDASEGRAFVIFYLKFVILVGTQGQTVTTWVVTCKCSHHDYPGSHIGLSNPSDFPSNTCEYLGGRDDNKIPTTRLVTGCIYTDYTKPSQNEYLFVSVTDLLNNDGPFHQRRHHGGHGHPPATGPHQGNVLQWRHLSVVASDVSNCL